MDTTKKRKTRKVMNLDLPGCSISVVIRFCDDFPVRVYRIAGGGRYGSRCQIAKAKSVVDALGFVYNYVSKGAYKA